MHRRFYAFLWIVIVLIGAGCNNGGDIQLTLVSQNVALSTEIADIRSTATYAADRVNQTAEYVGTAIAQGNQLSGLLDSTLAASGVDASLITPGAPIPTRPIENVVPQQPITNITPAVTDESGAPLASSALVTGTALPLPSLYNIVTTDGVGSNDCALGTVSSFSSSTEQIYVVATAANIPPNTRLSSRWFQAGTEVVFHDFTPDFTIEENCIWFYIDQTDIAFTPGNWSVQLSINDTPASSPVAFAITE